MNPRLITKSIIAKIDESDSGIDEGGVNYEIEVDGLLIHFHVRFITEWTEVELPDYPEPKWRSVKFSCQAYDGDGNQVELGTEIAEAVIKAFEV